MRSTREPGQLRTGDFERRGTWPPRLPAERRETKRLVEPDGSHRYHGLRASDRPARYQGRPASPAERRPPWSRARKGRTLEIEGTVHDADGEVGWYHETLTLSS